MTASANSLEHSIPPKDPEQLLAYASELRAQCSALRASNQELRRELERCLTKREDERLAFMNAATSAFGIYDSELNLIEINDAGLAWWPGRSRADLIGTNIRELAPSTADESIWQRLEQVVTTGTPLVLEHYVPSRADFGDVVIELHAFPVIDGLGLISSDVTERKRARDALEQQVARHAHELTEANARLEHELHQKDTLLREIHHRVKNNLQIVSSLIHFQAKKFSTHEDRRVFLELRQRLMAMAIVHEQLYRSDDFARVDFGDYIRSLVDALQMSIETEANIDITVVAGEVTLPLELAVPAGMIVCELVTNVFKYAFPRAGPGSASVSVSTQHGRVTLTTHDTGVGFPPGFDCARSGSFGWTLIRSLVAQLGAELEVDNARGARVRVTFDAPVRAASSPPTPESDRPTAPRIFVVEDEALVALELQDRLREFGYEVCGHAARGDEALAKIPALRPDLVLMDVNLGRGISGVDVFTRLRERIDVPVLFITAYSGSELARLAAGLEPFDYVTKPVRVRELELSIERILGAHQRPRASVPRA